MPVLHHALLDEKARSREGTASLDPLRGKVRQAAWAHHT